MDQTPDAPKNSAANPAAAAPGVRSERSPASELGTVIRPGVRLGCKGWYRPGRWLLERERCHLGDSEPVPPFHEPDAVQGSVRHVLGRLGLASASLQSTLQEEWTTLVGEDVARRTRPGPVRDRELTVFVRGSVWYSELKRNGSKTIRDRVVARLGAQYVNRIVLRPDPEGGVAR